MWSAVCARETKKRVQAGWREQRWVSGVICDRSIAVKGKVFKTVVRPAVIYGLEAMALTKTQAVELEVLRLSLVVARMDMIRNWTKDVELPGRRKTGRTQTEEVKEDMQMVGVTEEDRVR